MDFDLTGHFFVMSSVVFACLCDLLLSLFSNCGSYALGGILLGLFWLVSSRLIIVQPLFSEKNTNHMRTMFCWTSFVAKMMRRQNCSFDSVSVITQIRLRESGPIYTFSVTRDNSSPEFPLPS